METFKEYDPATPVSTSYCSQMSVREYEIEGSLETCSALQSLMEYMDSNPEVFRKILAKKKQEEAENEGIFSFLKCKVLERFKGPNFMLDEIDQEESIKHQKDLQDEMCAVYDYVQDTKASPRRFSRRLAAKRTKRTKSEQGTPKKVKAPAHPPPPPPYPPPGSSGEAFTTDADGTLAPRSILTIAPSPRKPLHRGTCAGDGSRKKGSHHPPASHPPAVPPSMVPPPPPPPPPPALSNTPNSAAKKPLKDTTNLVTSPTGPAGSPLKIINGKGTLTKCGLSTTQLKRAGSTTSLSSLHSVHDELLTFNRENLKSVASRTPCTPNKNGHSSGGSGSRPSSRCIPGELSVDSFNLKILEKFRNVRSPPQHGSPASGFGSPSSGFNSPSGFSP